MMYYAEGDINKFLKIQTISIKNYVYLLRFRNIDKSKKEHFND